MANTSLSGQVIDKAFRLWDQSTGSTIVRVFEGTGADIHSVAWARTEKCWPRPGTTGFATWDALSGQLLREIFDSREVPAPRLGAPTGSDWLWA